MTFSSAKVKRDLRAFTRWLGGEADPDTGLTWHQWNTKQLVRIRNDKGGQTDHWMNIVWGLLTQVSPMALLALATVSRLDLSVTVAPAPFNSPYILFLIATAILWTVLYWALKTAGRFKQYDRRGWRLWSFWAMFSAGIAFTVYMAVLTRWYSGSGIINLLLILFANLCLALAAHRAATHIATRSPRGRAFVDAGYKVLDTLTGYIVLGILGFLSLLGIIARIQTTLLFNVTFARSVKRGSIVRTIGRKNMEGAPASLGALLGSDGDGSVRSSPPTPTLPGAHGVSASGAAALTVGGARGRRGARGALAQQPGAHHA